MASTQAITFEAWLTKQGKRNTPVGDLARDVSRDTGWPAGAGIQQYRAHMQHRPASDLAKAALEKAWKSYKAYVRRSEVPAH
jgi:hypothetical protein